MTLLAQDASCPCENCPELIQDATIVHEFRLNVFNVQNNDLGDANQCVSRVGVTFNHTYLGDVKMELESPDGDIVRLIGPITFSLGSSGQTDNTTFKVDFVPSSEIPVPENGFNAQWDNEQNWALFGGTREGTYHPFNGKLEDFDSGRVNGTWILRVTDDVSPDLSLPNEKTDEGEFLDFFVEFCEDEGLVCDPCLDPEDDPICTFKVDGAEQTVVPAENFCLPIYAENVAFLEDMQFAINWNPTLIRYTGVDSFRIEFLEQSDFNTTDVANGNLSVAYNHTFDNLGLVVKDSTPIFQVCFATLGSVGDSTKITFPGTPLAIDVDGMTMPSISIEGTVKIAVDSTADCIRAIQLCDNSPIDVEKSRGPGFDKTEGGACFPQNEEHQAKWYKFDIIQSGDLELVIRPKGEASYGFTLVKGTCPSEVSSEEVSCLNGSSLTTRSVGIADNSQGSFGEIDQSSFQPTINALEQEIYYLLVDNFSNNGVGFDLEFGGTAVIGDYTLQAKIADPATINCNQPTIQLDATASTQGVGYVPTWSTDTGQINTMPGIFEPLILKGGSFTLEIIDTRTGCISKTTALVETDQIDPLAEAGEGGTVDCTSPTLSLSSAGSSNGTKFEVKWSTTNGVIDDDITQESVLVSAGGLYEVEITNVENGCSTKDEVLVDSKFDNPHLEAADNSISCLEPIATLVAISNTPGVQYNWIVSDVTTAITDSTYVANDTGIYVVKVTAPNGCSSFDSIYVREERVFPNVEAGDSTIVNCANPLRTLSGTGSSENAPFTYQWTTQNGHFTETSDQTSLFPQVDSSGLYKLSVTNSENGCISIDSVFVDSSFIFPVAVLQSDTLLNCYQPEIIIDASASDSGLIYAFSWFVVEGNILEGEDTYHAKVDNAGSYFINIENTENGCISTSEILRISPDTIRPIANAGNEETLNCTQRIVILDGTASSEGNEFSYEWNTNDGNFIGDTLNNTTEVDSAGLYTIKVIDDSNGCQSTASVRISKDFEIPNLQIPNDSTLTCMIPSILLESISSTLNTEFLWTNPSGEQTEGANITTQISGNFIALVTAANGCTNTDTVFIDAKQEFPQIEIQKPQTITCENSVIALNGEKSDDGGEFSPFWTTTDGHFVNEEERNTLAPGIDQGGTYLLEITNVKTGCIVSDSVVVPSNVDPPSIDFLELPDTLTCTNKTVSVTAMSNVDNPQFQWKSDQELITEEAELTISTPGDYNIFVTNPVNSCSFTRTITIFNDTIMPIADAGGSSELNCVINEVILDGTNSSQGETFQYLWTISGSESVSDSLRFSAEKSGLYTLIVLDRTNGCRTLDTVRVIESRDNPIADAGKDTIYCRGTEDLEILLGGVETSVGENFTYRWRDVQGVDLGTEQKQVITLADTFLLEVTNTNNKCVAIDTIEVIEKNAPIIAFSTTGGINCQQNELIYTALSDSPQRRISWEGKDGFFIEDSILTVTDEVLNQTFIAVVVDEITGCISNKTIVVSADRLAPIVDAGKDTELNCSDTLNLEGRILSQNINAIITWRTEDGNIVTAKDSLTPIVDAAGTYILNIENRSNFCQSEDTVLVITDQILPIILLNTDTLLTCNEPFLRLQPDSVSTGTNFYYEWRDSENKILGTTATLEVDLPNIYQLRVIDSINLCTQFASIEVLDSLNPPEIIIEEPGVLSCLKEAVELQAMISVDQGIFAWTFVSDVGNILGDTSQTTIQVNEAGIYQIEATNAISGCTSIRTIEVTDIQEPILIEAGEDQTITCYNDTTVVLTGTIFSQSENLIYNWTSSLDEFQTLDSSLTLTIETAGDFFFTVIDTVSGCQTIDTIKVDENIQAITFELDKEVFLDCDQSEILIGEPNANTSEDIRFTWSSETGNIVEGMNESAALVNEAGLYSINVINTLNGCTYADSIEVNSDKLLPIADAGLNQTLTCREELIIIGSENTSVGDQFQYNWTTIDGSILEGETTAFPTVNQAGTYELMILDTTNQCSETATVVIEEDKSVSNATLPESLAFLCTNETLTITPTIAEDTQNITIEWSSLNGSIISPLDQLSIEVGTPGQYFIRLINNLNGCQTNDSLVVIDNRASPAVAELTDRMLGCNNESITLSAIGSEIGNQIQYEWLEENGTPVSNNTTLTVDEAGVFILKVTNTDNNCFAQDTVQVTENINPPTSANFVIETPSCNGIDNGIIEVADVIGGTAPFSYQLNLGEVVRDPQFRDLPSQNYQLTIIDELDCQWDTLIVLDQPALLEAELQVSDDDLVTNEVATFTVISNIPEEAISEINWTPEELFDCLNCTQQTTSFLNSTAVEVTIIDENGCSVSAALAVEVSLAQVPNAITPNGDGQNDEFIVPAIEANPTGFPESELIIFNRWNDVLYKASPYNNDWSGTTSNGQSLPQGTYYYVLRLDVREGETLKGEITILGRR